MTHGGVFGTILSGRLFLICLYFFASFYGVKFVTVFEVASLGDFLLACLRENTLFLYM